MDDLQQPLSCDTSTVTGASQHLEWVDLKKHSIGAKRIEGGAAVSFDLEFADLVEALVAHENACCGDWLSLSVSRSGGVVRLEMTSEYPEALAQIEGAAGIGSE